MKQFRPYRFPPLAQFKAANERSAGTEDQWQIAVSEGFQQGQKDGYDLGLERGRQDGYEAGLRQGTQQGRDEGRRETLVSFDTLARPLDAMLAGLEKIGSDYREAQRKEVVDLVAKVARQVIRAELALQPVQLLALVDETLASMPPTRDEIEVFLNPEELQRIKELDPKRAARWTLIPDSRLDLGECRVKAGDHEADAGCQQRLAACLEQVSEQLQNAADTPDEEAAS
ncbi:flagellar assembly protein FliH [Undibacterium sp. TJN25]|uniref:flagellar assembly protein FliH n=1 Tax=Undibacterium sp. TJN25 TaxID=3413056 RepID=UPI003BF19883